MAAKRFTLTMPEKIMEELKARADSNGSTTKEVVRQCLQLGLIGLAVVEDDNKQLIIEEGDQRTALKLI